MKNSQKGFVVPLLITITVLALLGIGGRTYVNNQKIESESKVNVFQENSTSTEIKNTNTSTKDNSKQAVINSANKAKDELNDSAGAKIITEVKTEEDSLGNVAPSLIIDPKVMTETMLKRLDQKAYMNDLLNLQITTMLGSFEIYAIEHKEKNGSYSGLCNNSKEFLTSHTGIAQTYGDELSIELYKQTGTTIESYKINQSVCKSNDKSYVLTMPIPLKDGSQGTVCTSARVGTASPVVIGQADFNTFTCIKN